MAIFAGLLVDPDHRTLEALLAQPAVLSVPLAFATMAVVSLLDTQRTPAARRRAARAPRARGLGLGAEEDAVRA